MMTDYAGICLVCSCGWWVCVCLVVLLGLLCFVVDGTCGGGVRSGAFLMGFYGLVHEYIVVVV